MRLSFDLMSKLNDILRATYRKDYEALEALLRNSNDANARDDDGRTPLMHAVLAEDADPAVLKFLIQHGANVNAADAQHWTALHFAAQDQKKDVAGTLLESGALVDPVDSFGNTPLWRAVMNFRGDPGTIEVLLRHGADPHKKNKTEVSPIELARTAGQAEIVNLLEGKHW